MFLLDENIYSLSGFEIHKLNYSNRGVLPMTSLRRHIVYLNCLYIRLRIQYVIGRYFVKFAKVQVFYLFALEAGQWEWLVMKKAFEMTLLYFYDRSRVILTV